jgi:hypothetical protein
MVATDSRSEWPAALLSDNRGIHLWDESKVVGRWFAERTSGIKSQLAPGSAWRDGEILWDAFLLYGADARWDDLPTGLIHWGRTIVAGRETLKRDFNELFGPTK